MPDLDPDILPDDFLALLRCPVTGSRLRLDGPWLVAEIGGLRYPIREGIPVLLADEATLPPGIQSLDQFKLQFKDQLKS
jgi:uncharacterized protein